MWLFVVYHVLSASQNCQNVLAIHFSISVLDKAVNLIDLATNANNANLMHDIKISTGCLPSICAIKQLVGANNRTTRVNTTKRLTTIFIKAILERMEVSEMHGVMPNSMPVRFTIDL